MWPWLRLQCRIDKIFRLLQHSCWKLFLAGRKIALVSNTVFATLSYIPTQSIFPIFLKTNFWWIKRFSTLVKRRDTSAECIEDRWMYRYCRHTYICTCIEPVQRTGNSAEKSEARHANLALHFHQTTASGRGEPFGLYKMRRDIMT